MAIIRENGLNLWRDDDVNKTVTTDKKNIKECLIFGMSNTLEVRYTIYRRRCTSCHKSAAVDGNTRWEMRYNLAIFLPFGFFLSAMLYAGLIESKWNHQIKWLQKQRKKALMYLTERRKKFLLTKDIVLESSYNLYANVRRN